LGTLPERVREFPVLRPKVGLPGTDWTLQAVVGRESPAGDPLRKQLPPHGINTERRERKLSVWRVHRWVKRVRDRLARLPVSYGFRTMSRASASRKCRNASRLQSFESVTVSAERAGRY